jgi:hypothetical protein
LADKPQFLWSIEMKKTLLALAAVAVLSTSASASVLTYTFPDFTVAEGSVPLSAANTFVADKLNGGYTEMVTVSNTGLFTASAYGNFGGFFSNGGSQIVSPTQLNGVGVGGYGLYAVFQSTGQVISSTLFQGLTGSFSLYLDPNQNTTKSLTSSGAAATLGLTADDILVARSSVLSYGLGTIISPTAFEFLFSGLTLTAAGSNYFTSPNPFYLSANVDGNVIGLGGTAGNYNVTGAMNVSYNQIPEPGSLALLGLGLAGLGLAKRRRQSEK